MRWLGLVLLTVILTFSLTGCGLLQGTPLEGIDNSVETVIAKPLNVILKRTPEGEFKHFMEAMQDKDYTKAAEYISSKGQKKDLDKLKVSNNIAIRKVQYENNDPNSDLVVIYYNQKESAGTLKSGTLEAVLVKENGSWKVKSWDRETQQDY